MLRKFPAQVPKLVGSGISKSNLTKSLHGFPPTAAKISSSAWPQAAKRFTRFKALPADTVNEGKFGRRGKWMKMVSWKNEKSWVWYFKKRINWIFMMMMTMILFNDFLFLLFQTSCVKVQGTVSPIAAEPAAAHSSPPCLLRPAAKP